MEHRIEVPCALFHAAQQMTHEVDEMRVAEEVEGVALAVEERAIDLEPNDGAFLRPAFFLVKARHEDEDRMDPAQIVFVGVVGLGRDFGEKLERAPVAESSFGPLFLGKPETGNVRVAPAGRSAVEGDIGLTLKLEGCRALSAVLRLIGVEDIRKDVPESGQIVLGRRHGIILGLRGCF